MNPIIRLLLVDDHAVVREGYRRLLERRPDLRIEAEAADAAEAYRLFRDTAPDVVILDLALPDMGGVELTRRLVQRDPQARILAFSMHRDPLFASQALRAGALGYVTKSCAPDVLIKAVYQVAARQRVLSPDIAPDLALALLDDPGQPGGRPHPARVRDPAFVAGWEVGGGDWRCAAISPKTAQNCHYQIKAKLGVKSDIELVRLAMRWNLVGSR